MRSYGIEQTKPLLNELPFYNINYIQELSLVNNSLTANLPTKKYCEKFRSMRDLDLFNLSTAFDTNLDINIGKVKKIPVKY